MTMKPHYLILAGALSFVVGILVQAPAALLYAWLAPKLEAPVQLLGITGTLTRGAVTQIRQNNQLVAADVDWTLRPLSLLLAQLRYQLQSDKAPLMFTGEVSQGISGTSLRQVNANSELRALAAAADQAFVPVNGTASLDLAELKLRDGWPVTAEGLVRLGGVAWTLGKEPVSLGDFQAQLRTEDDQIIAQISTTGGNVEVNGEARLRNDRSYDYALKLKSKADAPPMIANLMRQLGNPDGQGYYTLEKRGSAPQPEPVVDAGAAPDLSGQPTNPSRRNTPQPANSPPTSQPLDENGLSFGP